jgi:plastocyanin
VASAKVKGLRGSGGNVINPEYTFSKGGLETFHIINEDYATKANHNFNLDEFNVHTKTLGPSESQTITFLADKAGTFEYYCTIHPGMNGTITVVE